MLIFSGYSPLASLLEALLVFFTTHTIKTVREVLKTPVLREADGTGCKINVPMKLEIVTFIHFKDYICISNPGGRQNFSSAAGLSR